MTSPAPASRKPNPAPSILGKLLLFLFMLVPLALALLGAWVGSTLMVHHGGPWWLALLGSLVVFLVLPLVWERIADPDQQGGRLRDAILRSSVLSTALIVIVIATHPVSTFSALATRGDWFLAGSRTPAAESIRRALFTVADRLEWLNDWAREKPFADADDSKTIDPGTIASSKSPEPPQKAVDAKGETRRWPIPGTSYTWPMPETIHPAVTAMPPEASASIASIGAYLKTTIADPYERTKALHDYVATHIRYDCDRLARNDITADSQAAARVLATGLGVCSGYSNLTMAIGKKAGLEVIRLSGDIRRAMDFDASTSERIDFDGGPGHAWNAVRIDNRWHFFDTTWDAGFCENGPTFKSEFRSVYLFTPPEVLILDHRAYEDKWQLLEQPVSRADWLRQPLMDPLSRLYEVLPLDLDRPIIARQAPLTFRFGKPPGTAVTAEWDIESAASRHCKSSDSGDREASIACPPRDARARVVFFARLPSEERGTYIGSVIVD